LIHCKNIDIQLRKEILHHTRFNQVNSLGMYLGANLSPRKSLRGKFNHIVSKIQSKVNGRKKQCLSLAGRITLAKSVISTIPYYHMQYAKIPKTICDKFDKIQWVFVWADSE